MNKNTIEIISQILQISHEDVRKNSKYLPEIPAYYCWNPIRGGNALVINEQGEKLIATSAVDSESHIKAFIEGKRN